MTAVDLSPHRRMTLSDSMHYHHFSPRPAGRGGFDSALIQRLKAAPFSHRVTLLEAPAGYGKTMVLNALYQHALQQGVNTIWLALDGTDVDAEAFAALLLQACHASTRADDSVEPDTLSCYDKLIASILSYSGGRRAIFIDNVECCRDPRLPILLDHLIALWPDDHSLWLASSFRIDIDVVRHSTEGVLRYLDVSSLRFTREDMHVFLIEHDVATLSEADIDTLSERTQGWPLAVGLLGHLFRESEPNTPTLTHFSGNDIGICAFVNHQVLPAFEEPLQTFLCKIALLPQINYDLCRMATAEGDSAHFIDRLLKANAFLTLLDRTGQRLALHPLVRDALIIEARKRLDPLVVQQILARAAQWGYRSQSWELAVECALMSRCATLVAALLHDIAPIWVGQKGNLLPYITWVEQAEKIGAVLTLEASYWYLWALCYARQFIKALGQLARLQQRFREEGAEMNVERRESLRRRLEELLILIAFFQDQNELAGREALKWLDDTIEQDSISMATVACCVAITACINYDFSTARAAISSAQAGIALSNSAYGTAWVAVLSAQIDFFDGDYFHALQSLRLAQEQAIAALGKDAIIVSTAQLLMGCCLLKMGRYEEARAHLLPGLSRISLHGISEITCCGLEAALDLWDGIADGPLAPTTLEHLIVSYPAPVIELFRCLLARRQLQLGALEEAVYQAKRGGVDLESSQRCRLQATSAFTEQLRGMMRLDYLVLRGEYKQAELFALALLNNATSNKQRGRIVELEIMLAVIAHHTGEPAQAQRHLFRAIRFAAKQHIIHPFLVKNIPVHAILAHSSKKDGGFIDRDEIALFQELSGGEPRCEPGTTIESETFAGHLTARELELIHLVDSGLSNQQIADRTNVSITTVKWHLSNIYAKLNVKNRTAALAAIRALKR